MWQVRGEQLMFGQSQHKGRKEDGQRCWGPDVDGRVVGLAGERLLDLLMGKYCW